MSVTLNVSFNRINAETVIRMCVPKHNEIKPLECVLHYAELLESM